MIHWFERHSISVLDVLCCPSEKYILDNYEELPNRKYVTSLKLNGYKEREEFSCKNCLDFSLGEEVVEIIKEPFQPED